MSDDKFPHRLWVEREYRESGWTPAGTFPEEEIFTGFRAPEEADNAAWAETYVRETPELAAAPETAEQRDMLLWATRAAYAALGGHDDDCRIACENCTFSACPGPKLGYAIDAVEGDPEALRRVQKMMAEEGDNG